MNWLLTLGAWFDPPRRWDLAAPQARWSGPLGVLAPCVLVDRRGNLREAGLPVHDDGIVVAQPGSRIWRVRRRG